MPTAPDTEVAALARLIASRLRLIQADFADVPPDQRREHLTEEVERVLGDQTPARRRALLEELLEQFPTWDSEMARAARPPEDAGAGAEQSPVELARALAAMAPRMTPDEREAAARELRQSGLFAAGGPGGWSPQAENDLLERIGAPEDAALDADRVAGALAETAAFVGSVDRLVCKTWRELSGGAAGLPRDELALGVRRYATGDTDISRSQLAEQLEGIRSLIAALIASVGAVGRRLGDDLNQRLGPAAIEAIARQDKRWHEMGVDSACWRRYKEVAATLEETEIEREIKQLIVDGAKKYRHGTGSASERL